MNYTKNYDIGSIRLDAPKKHFIYELPLLSFADTRGAVGLSLVFNSSLSSTNDFYMSNGHKLNLQKRLIIVSGYPAIYEDGDGTRVNLIKKGNCYLFDDDSQRIIRGDSSKYVLEYPDYSTETFTTHGLITSVADKYGETYLTYTYESGKLASIKYRTNKFINLSYNNSGTLGSIEYVSGEDSVCIISLEYNEIAHLIVTHHSGVMYYTTYSGGVFTAYSTDKSSAYSNDYSQKIICTEVTDTITIEKRVGSETVDLATYKFTDYSPVDGESYSQIEVTDFYGVKSRTQFRGNHSLFTYEIGESDVEFNDDNYPGSVQIHRYSTMNGGVDIGEKCYVNIGVPLRIEGGNLFKKWTITNLNIPENKNGTCILTGWIKLLNNSKNRDIIELYVTNDTENPDWGYSFSLPKPPIAQWSYFAVPIFGVENDVDIPISDFMDDVETKDFRLLDKSVHSLPGSDAKYLSPLESILVYHGNSTPVYIPLAEATFKCGDVDLSAGGLIYYEDLLKYKINKWKNLNTTEFYCNRGRNLLTINSSEEVTLTYKNNTYNLSDCYLGQYQYNIRGAIITQIIDDSSSYLTISATDSGGNLISSQNINSDLDVISSTANGVTTNYERIDYTASNYLIMKEKIADLYYTETWYTDNAITVYNVNEDDNSNISYVTYNIDPIWGAVTSIVDSEGAKITDTHDDDKCALLSREFNDNPSITNLFTYESGNLSTLANGSLKYKMSYNKGRLSGISKLDATTEDTYNSIESHSYANNGGRVTLTDSYPSATNPLHTVTSYYDEYGRLTSVSDVLSNTYNSDPCCIYETERYTGLPSDAYDLDGTAELSFENLGCNNASAKLASSKDLLTEKTTHYGYCGDRLVAVKTTNASSTLSKEVFAYDDVYRLTTDRFDYDLANSKFVKSVITYDDTNGSPLTTNRVQSYKYYVNSLSIHRARTINHFDNYNRINQKEVAIQNYGFNKYYTYDKTNVKSVESKYLNSTRLIKNEYAYDVFGKIIGERYIDTATKNKSYVYDSFGRLVRENNQLLDKTFIYSYNEIGNIGSVKEYDYTLNATPSGSPLTTSYTYSSEHPDRLARYGYNNISYNSIGYPESYGDKWFVWTNGKLTRLYDDVDDSSSYSSEDICFTYDAYGRRLTKTYTYDPGEDYSGDFLTGSTTTYTYDNSGRLIREHRTEIYSESSDVTREFVYLYDESNVIGFVYTLNGTPSSYYYLRNLQGDVIGIYDVFGVKVCGYAYDAFGNCSIVYGSSNDLAYVNPIRYRGYYFDSETGLYYLNARYYNPEWRRFISPDDTAYLDPESANGLNLYAYCGNDPINYCDPSGHFPTIALLIGIGISALFGGITAGVSSALDGNTGWGLVGDILGGVLIGGATGAAFTLGGLAGAGMIGAKAAIIGFSVSTVASFGAGFGANVLQSTFRGENVDWNEAWQDGALTAIQSTVCFWVGASMSAGGMWKSLNIKAYSTSIGWFKNIGQGAVTSSINGSLLYFELFGKEMIIRTGVKFLYTYLWSYLRNNN